MHIERDGRGHLRTVSKPKGKGDHGRSKPTAHAFDRPTGGDPGRAPKASGSSRYPHGRDEGYRPRTQEPVYHPPARDPPRNIRPPGRPANSADPVHRTQPMRFDEKRGVRRDSKDLYEEASWQVSPDTGTKYPCKQSDLDACGGYYRFASNRRDKTELRAMLFAQPNTTPKVSIRRAALDIYQHNAPGRMPSDKEFEAIDRLCIMIDNACHGFWGPDVAIKCFCDLDTVFFRGKLKEHVCITWAGQEEFETPTTFGHTHLLGHGKARIQLNAQYIFLKPGYWHERPLNQTLATILHEGW